MFRAMIKKWLTEAERHKRVPLDTGLWRGIAWGREQCAEELREVVTVHTHDRDQLLRMAQCPHRAIIRGSGYLFCEDCNLMWDYRRERPTDAMLALLVAHLKEYH